jgi:hypothetical protein
VDWDEVLEHKMEEHLYAEEQRELYKKVSAFCEEFYAKHGEPPDGDIILEALELPGESFEDVDAFLYRWIAERPRR